MSEPHNSLRTIFSEALEIPDAQRRAAYLSQACGADAALRREVEELIQANAATGQFLPEQPAADGGRAALIGSAEALGLGGTILHQTQLAEKPGDRIGRYKLREKIGEGGCGVVYVGEQEEPVRRRVALKVIKLGMDTKSVIARFDAERQALAMMDHPNIAKVFDAGATETGRPFFVMELVRGIKITDYCDQNNLSTRERLDLFVQVCRAVQHAHQKGIIHRDLKPSNILVTLHDGVPVPKVIDFGIAKATAGRLTDLTVYTELHQFIGTPAYMSPEQAEMSGLDIDTRSDVYSLGVLLYELLTGKTPFDTQALLAAGLDEMRRTIREKEPMRPSTRLSTMAGQELTTTAKRRGADAPRLISLLRGDLDWIVMKALEKDRARRYETVNGFARDIERHLNDEPVLARPPSRLYELQRAVRRHKLGFATAAMVITALAAGVLVSTWQAVRAERQRQQVQRNVIRQYVANGTRLMNEGDLFGSLLWYAEALRLDEGDPRREEPHRIRIASVLRQCPKLQNVFSHGKMLYHADFSPDGSKVLTSSDDHTARLWDATTGQELLVLRHNGDVYDATFSPDGLRIVTSSQDKTARVWDGQTGALVCTLGHKDTVWRSCFSPDGRLVATACQDKTAQLWNAATGERTGEPLLHESIVERVTFSPDGRLLGTVTGDSIGCVWEVAKGQRRFRCAQNLRFADVVFSPDSQRFLTCDGPNLRVRDATTLKEVSFSPLKLTGDINDIGFSPDGRTIVAGGDDFTARVWDASTGQPLFAQPVQHAGRILGARISPDGRSFVTASVDAVAQLWRTATGQTAAPSLKHILHVKYVRFNGDGRRLLGNSCDQAARVWDMATSDLPGASRPRLPNERHVISTNGQYLLLQGESNIVWITDTYSGRRLALPHKNEVVYASFSRDGRSVLTACEEMNGVSSMRNDIFLWDALTGRRLNTVNMAQSFRLLYVAWSPDNSRLLTCGFDYSARVWDARTGQPVSELMRHRQPIAWGAFSPDGRSVVTASGDRTARVWDAATGNPLTAPLQHKARVTGARWSADGKRLHTLTEDDHVQVWDLASGEPLTPSRQTQEPLNDQLPLNALAAAQRTEDLPRDNRRVADLVLLSQMLAVGRIDNSGNVVPLQLHELTGAWRTLREKYPEQFATTPSEVAGWHRREAEQSEAEGNLAAALFHLDRELEMQPRNPVLTQKRAELAAALAQGNSPAVHPANRPLHIPPRDPKAGADQIDLSPHYNLGLRDSLDQKPNGNDFAGLPEGLHTFGGVRFDVRGLVYLIGQETKRTGLNYPKHVEGVRVARLCRRLHFLQAGDWGDETGDGIQVGSYVLHYADGQRLELPIVSGRDLGDWWWEGAPPAPKEPGAGLVVWTGTNRRAAAAENASICLYKSTRANPRPDTAVVSIDFVSSMSPAALFLVALTVE